MLNIERLPAASVPVVAPGDWHEQAPALDSGPRPFLSQDEDRNEQAMETREPVFFPASAPEEGHSPDATPPVEPSTEYHPVEPLESFRPQFAELSDAPPAPLYIPHRSDDANQPGDGNGPTESGDRVEQPAAHFPDSYEESQRDLDVPAFMRRLRF